MRSLATPGTQPALRGRSQYLRGGVCLDFVMNSSVGSWHGGARGRIGGQMLVKDVQARVCGSGCQ